MKLLRHGPPGAEGPGLVAEDGTIRDLAGRVADFAAEGISLSAIAEISQIDPDSLPTIAPETRIGACVASVPNFHCVGLNYARHARESGMEPPGEPILFSKASSALSGPCDDIPRPRGSTKLDYEAELGIVIGAEVEHIAEADALSVVSGYCVINDVSERQFQLERLGQWIKGKSAPGFGPVGPWLVTPDEVPDPQALGIWLEVNGERRQNSSTSDMIFGVAEIIAYMSRFMRLLPGDVIAAGTPEGVILGMAEPKPWLQPGDEIRLGIDGLGEQHQTVIATH